MKYKLPDTATGPFCPTEYKETISPSSGSGIVQRFKRFAGVGFLVAVGYMDPGNWATDIEAGSKFGYALLFVILLASLVAMLLQTLCVRMGLASGRDLAQLCHDRFSPRVNFILWIFAEIAIIACDFAEVLGTALALKLLFGLPLSVGVLLTAFDTVIVLFLQGKGFLRLEAIIISLVMVISSAFVIELFLSKPDWGAVATGFVPDFSLFNQVDAWILAIGIFGATVMPHNLYLHSSAVNSRKIEKTEEGKADAINMLTFDILITLGIAFFINAAILILAASAFHSLGHTDVKEIDDAYYLLAPTLGTAFASIIFGLALFASGQSSTLTGTIAGQVIFQGFLNISIPCWQQRLLVRSLAIVPAWLGIYIMGEDSIGQLLVLSQVILSMQLPFAVIPLVIFNSNAEIMGRWKLSKPMILLCWLISLLIIAANLFMIYQVVKG